MLTARPHTPANWLGYITVKKATLPSRPVRRLGIHLRFSLIAGSAMVESSQNLHPLNKINI